MKKVVVEKENICNNAETAYQRRPNERGSALVMVLLISSLLLVASVGILLEASLNSANVTDAVSEQQAYQAAESGIQTAINALRRNVTPNPLVGGTNASDLVNRINFRKAVTPSISNKPGETGEARLSRWINYNYTSPGATQPTRAVLANGAGTTSYDPKSGYAFSVTLTDPDDTGKDLQFATSGTINGQAAAYTVTGLAITYLPKSTTTLDVSNGATPSTDLGRFAVVTTGGTIVEDIPFSIIVNMTEPFYSQRVIRGFITKGTTTANSMGDVKIILDADTYELMGSQTVLFRDNSLNPLEKITYNSRDYFTIPLAANNSKTINATMTQAEPLRLMLRSIGYGPRGSQKILEAFIRKNLFDGLPAPATLTLVGEPPTDPNAKMDFDSGQSQNVSYSGVDVANSKIVIPPIGTSNSRNLKAVTDNLSGKSKTDVYGTPANVIDEMPPWLKSPAALEKTIAALEELAKASGRYFSNGKVPATFGDVNTATGITFIDGDVDIQGNGGGILVCTGTLSFKGNFAFNGLIIATGAGGVIRKGGGGSTGIEKGTLQGNMVVAPYNRSNIGSIFLTPKYNMNGGGTSTVEYNSSSVSNGQEALSNLVLGIAEK